MFTDSHCHLAFPELQEKLPEIRAAMVQAQVDRALCICTTLEEFPTVHGLALAHNNFWATAGVHPDNEVETEPTLADLLRLGSLPRVVGIGETGLEEALPTWNGNARVFAPTSARPGNLVNRW